MRKQSNPSSPNQVNPTDEVAQQMIANYTGLLNSSLIATNDWDSLQNMLENHLR